MKKGHYLFEDMMRFFDEFFNERFSGETQRLLSGPAQAIESRTYTDMVETESSVIFTAELPGIRKEDIEINITENSIDVKVESQKTEEKKEKREYNYMSRYSKFHSSYKTPVPINTETVTAGYKNGILEVKAAKLEQKKKKQINIK